MQNAFENTTAIGTLFCCDPIDFTVSEVLCRVLEEQAEEESDEPEESECEEKRDLSPRL